MLNEPGGTPAQPPNPLPTAYWRWILTPGLVGSALVGQDVPRGGHAVCPQSLLSPVRLDPGGGGDGQTTAQQTSGQQHAGNHLKDHTQLSLYMYRDIPYDIYRYTNNTTEMEKW